MATEKIYTVHQSLFYTWRFSTVAIITLKDILSTNLFPTLFILHFSQPFHHKTTYSVYRLMGPSGTLRDFSTAPSFYLISTALPSHGSHYTMTTRFLFSLEVPFLLPNWWPLFNACRVFCHFVQFAHLWRNTFALACRSIIPSATWHKVYHMMYWPSVLLLSLYALIILH